MHSIYELQIIVHSVHVVGSCVPDGIEKIYNCHNLFWYAVQGCQVLVTEKSKSLF